MAAQENDLNDKAVAHEIYHTVQDPKCGLRKQHAEAVADIISSCTKLTRTEYTQRHNNVASIVYRVICAEYNLEDSRDWWVEPKRVVRDNHIKIFWNFSIQTDKHLLQNFPGIVLINYKKQTGLMTLKCLVMRTPRTKNSKI